MHWLIVLFVFLLLLLLCLVVLLVLNLIVVTVDQHSWSSTIHDESVLVQIHVNCLLNVALFSLFLLS